MNEYETITIEEVNEWVSSKFGGDGYAKDWLHEILTGEYHLDRAREDILSFREPD